jgi:CheY-like chemotaxis protein
VVGLDHTELGRVLDREGFAVQGVADGEAALECLERGPRDSLVTALRLPGMSGLTLTREALRRWPELAGSLALVAGVPPPGVPEGVTVCVPPVDRVAVLGGLGRRARRRRRT